MPSENENGYGIEAMNGVRLSSIVRHVFVCRFWRFWFAGGGELYGGTCRPLLPLETCVYYSFMPFSSPILRVFILFDVLIL